MKLKNISEEELETMSYDDIAYEILKETKKGLKINELFKEVCDLLHLDNTVYESQIGDFFQVLSTDQRFTMINNGYWDLKSRHHANIVMDLEDDDDVILNEEEEENDSVETEEEIYYDEDTDDDEVEDDLKDLVIVSDEEEINDDLA